ncbi:FAD-binding protein [Persicimonas caeni]|uniref:FAD-binding protein n=1 Tax=Persicimonas caeni TaxID=2292766 RepID=A0A4Y6PLQ3_PERCE|nr:NAD(P)/FAD-dependent oxidoreductase [Persicimonas caeni]QDG49246.1 FAD-binding protein [Persicimonas caeni]QED30467.1 FAD-binding protein [Persicimonas caeni]
MTEDNAPKRFRVNNLVRYLDEDESVIRQRAAQKMGVDESELVDFALIRRSLDARHKPRFNYNVEVAIEDARSLGKLPGNVQPAPDPGKFAKKKYEPTKQERVVIIGAGPAGLFAAHRLAEAGLKPILLDRGQPVEVRGRQVSKLMHKGELDPDSNICFGEGGAGTWSDGKLYTRVSDIRVKHILETIVELGGPSDILWKGKPHLGTDRLVGLCKAFRKRLTDLGAEVRFGAFVSDFVIDKTAGGNLVKQVVLRDGEKIDCDRVIMAVGHSAREMYRWLASNNVALEPKPFAVGFRVEHRQQLINEIQYGKWAGKEGLPTADYRLTANLKDGDKKRGVYSFCMCPGGQIVPSPTQPGGICVNGMSHASRKGHWANSALVVSIEPDDFGAFGDIDGLEDFGGQLAGMAFQREAERRAYELGGGGYIAPAQRLVDFREGRASKDVRESTYKPGIAAADLSQCYPDFIIENLQQALDRFDKKMGGYLTNDAILVGVETRTSAPVQVQRDDESFQSVSVGGLYPAGEGAGYGGGIVSAALDGLRVSERILEELS